MTEFEPIIGLEVHAELLTRSKMFCGCRVVDSTTAEPNSSVCEICTGMPGTLPVINRKAVEYALQVALALDCEIAPVNRFARKNYFYPDLPKGYQISQYALPLAVNGRLPLEREGRHIEVGIRRVHLEEDTGKLFHQEAASLIDYNRSGVPLLEIVSEPDLRSVEEVKAYASELRTLLQYLGVNSGDMEKGVIRFEANISLRPTGSDELFTRTEIKNLNSFRAMVGALEFEINRQREILARGERVQQETLGWDETSSETVPQRGKEEAHDYRYFPEPDLPPLKIEREWLDQLAESLPELPQAKRARFRKAYGLSPYTTRVLTAERPVAEFFEAAVKAVEQAAAEEVANWISGDLFALVNQTGTPLEQSPITPLSLAEIVDMVARGEINAAGGKRVLERLFQQGGSPTQVVKQEGLTQISDPEQIQLVVDQVLRANPEQVEAYLKGKTAITQWLFGQVMSATQGRADPAIVRERLDQSLGSLAENRPSE